MRVTQTSKMFYEWGVSKASSDLCVLDWPFHFALPFYFAKPKSVKNDLSTWMDDLSRLT